MISLSYIEGYKESKIPVIGPENANYLYIFNGIAVIRFKGNSGQWLRDTLSFKLPHKFSVIDNIKSISSNGSLNSIENIGPSLNAGWALDSINTIEEVTDFKELKVDIKLAVSDSDGFINRVSFQVFVLVEEGVLNE